jgi:anti-sigma factor RsiW
MQPGFQHAVEEDLERYSMGRLPEAEAGLLEEHLLICPACQNRLTETDNYVRALRAAALELLDKRSTDWRDPAKRAPAALALSRPIWIAGAAICLGLLSWVSGVWRSPHATGTAPVAIVLQAVRGGEPRAGAIAPRGRPLVLEADLSGLPPTAAGEMEVVDVNGIPVRRLRVKLESGRVAAQVPGGLSQGRYWIRLYASSAGNELLREYALRVE